MSTVDQVLRDQNDASRQPNAFMKKKLLENQQRNWDLFYKRNSTNFFKDRHWTAHEFRELEDPRITSMLEVGCGVGNFLFPLLKYREGLFVHCCDFSKRAIDLVKQTEGYSAERCNAFVNDLTCDSLRETVVEGVDLVSMIFVLSAIAPAKQQAALRNVNSVLKMGGMVIFRDYGQYDTAQLRFKAENKLGTDFYARTDGTFSVFFSVEGLCRLFGSAGFSVVESEYVERDVVNRKQEKTLQRVFVQGRFVKVADECLLGVYKHQ